MRTGFYDAEKTLYVRKVFITISCDSHTIHPQVCERVPPEMITRPQQYGGDLQANLGFRTVFRQRFCISKRVGEHRPLIKKMRAAKRGGEQYPCGAAPLELINNTSDYFSVNAFAAAKGLVSDSKAYILCLTYMSDA